LHLIGLVVQHEHWLNQIININQRQPFPCASEKYLDIISIGVTPPLHNQHQSAPTISVQSHLIEIVPQAHSNVPCLQPSTIHFIEDCETSVTIIHPVKGKQGSIGCWDCGWKMTCSTCHGRMRLVETSAICAYCHQKSEPPLTCPQCQGLKLNKGIPGIDQLKQQWKKHQTKAVEWRTTDNESLSRPFAKQSFVIVTLPELLSGHGEDMRAHERFVNRLRRLAAAVLEAEGTLALQQKIESDTSFFSLLSTDGYEKWRNQELKDRQVFNYPPYSKIIKILLDLAPEDVNTLMNEWKKKLPPIWKVKGPYELEMPSKSRRKRLVFQLICPKETPEKQLIQALDILKRYGIIDLDPIAFFR
jgi:primosomal protein N'